MCSDLEPLGELSLDDENDEVKEDESNGGIETWFSHADEEGVRILDEVEGQEVRCKE